MVQRLQQTVLRAPQKITIALPHDPATPLCVFIQKNCKQGLRVIAPHAHRSISHRSPKSPRGDEQRKGGSSNGINKGGNSDACDNTGDMMLSETSQSQKDTYLRTVSKRVQVLEARLA